MDDGWIRQVSPPLGDEEADAARRVVESGWITEGPEAAAFVEEFKVVTGAPYGVLAPNGTLALALGLMALGVGRGDEVLVPDITFIGSATSVVLAGARPVFVEVEPHTFQIDVSDAERRVAPATRAIMPVHLYGTACDMDAVTALAQRHGLKVIEDAAQGVGVCYRGRHVGALGDAGCFSFFADKTITTGEGGFVACRDPAIYERLRLLRNQGRMHSGTFIHPAVGYNLRMTDIQAAIGRVQLRKLESIIATKRALYDAYVEALAGAENVRVLGAAEHATMVPFRCVILADDAEGLMQRLAANKVEPRSFFYPLHRQPAFNPGSNPEETDGEFPNAVAGHRRGICLPLHVAMSQDDVVRVSALVRAHQAGRT
jgi:perosamine synthetase